MTRKQQIINKHHALSQDFKNKISFHSTVLSIVSNFKQIIISQPDSHKFKNHSLIKKKPKRKKRKKKNPQTPSEIEITINRPADKKLNIIDTILCSTPPIVFMLHHAWCHSLWGVASLRMHNDLATATIRHKTATVNFLRVI